MIAYDFLESAGGRIYTIVNEGVVEKILLGEREWQVYQTEKNCPHDKEACREVIEQLKEYFQGQRREFSVALKADGTDFFCRVWAAVAAIPYGEVRSYSEIAAQLDRPKACRAVGMANNKNPLPILIPCHRVIGKNGKMVGYKEFGVTFKEYLLRLEQGE
ncbi:methylated-DNA--[protein]-cysteine S-methyltransferase [Azotosporobacter soli]|uniref:methylated-DNA--[protein]-cysteine S-methyltransferase n=1 Tax=Azotosporobacter soli TaxID=3055040 RepID=UPI0031FE8020